VLITTYTTYAEIRSALGVGPEELADETIALPLYEHALDEELYSIDLNLPTTFQAIADLDQSSWTVAQARFYGAVCMFAVYAVAVKLSGLPLFAPKDITDGKASVSRDAGAPHKLVMDRCQKEYDRLRALVFSTLAGLSSGSAAAVVRPYF
jgi:hypothetical protein